MIRHYINLSNGLEQLSFNASWSILYLRSTTLERRNWCKLFLEELSDDLLWHLAGGVKCILHDRGTRRPLSKTVYYGVPLIKYVLDRYWYDVNPTTVFRNGPRGGLVEATNDFQSVYDFILKTRIRTRLNYYKNYTNSAVVSLIGNSKSTQHDGNRVRQNELSKLLIERTYKK